MPLRLDMVQVGTREERAEKGDITKIGRVPTGSPLWRTTSLYWERLAQREQQRIRDTLPLLPTPRRVLEENAAPVQKGRSKRALPPASR
jgi:hypothetical protein